MNKPISYYLKDFYVNKNISSLFKAIYLIFKEGRILEVLYGILSFIFYRPSKVVIYSKNKILFENYIDRLLKNEDNGFRGLIYLDYLEPIYGKKFPRHLIPDNFRMRKPTILHGKTG